MCAGHFVTLSLLSRNTNYPTATAEALTKPVAVTRASAYCCCVSGSKSSKKKKKKHKRTEHVERVADKL